MRMLGGVEQWKPNDDSDGGVIALEGFGWKELKPVVEFCQRRVLRGKVNGRPQRTMFGARTKALRQRMLLREEHRRTGVSCLRSKLRIAGHIREGRDRVWVDLDR